MLLLWLSIMFLRFFYVVACMSASFLFMAQCYSPIWIYSTFHLSIYQLMDIWVVSTFWLFCVMLPWAFMYKFCVTTFFTSLGYVLECVCEYQFSSFAQSCPTLCNPMDCSTPGLPVHHQLPELAQIHVHRASDVIQSSHPLSSPSPPAFNLSQHQGLFQGVSSLHKVAEGLELQLQPSVLPMNTQD